MKYDRIVSHLAGFMVRLESRYELTQNERFKGALDIALLIRRCNEMRDLLKRLHDEVQALDGTSIENEKLVDDYRTLMQTLIPE